MWDEEHDKEMMRNQMIAIGLMVLLLVGWYFFFVPQQALRPPVGDVPTQVTGTANPLAEREVVASAPGGQISRAVASEDGNAWPYLPPIPQQPDPFEDEIVIADDALRLVFTRIGGRLKRASVLLGEDGIDTIQMIPDGGGKLDTETVYPLGLRFTDPSIGDGLDWRRFDAEVDPSGRSVQFSLELPGAARIRKTFTLSEKLHVLDLRIEYENKESASRVLGMDATPAYILNWGPEVVTGNEGGRFTESIIWRTESGNELLPVTDLPIKGGNPNERLIPGAQWIGQQGKYFIAAIRPREQIGDGWAEGTASEIRFGMTVPRFEVRPGEIHTNDFELYLGPMHLGSLSQAWPTLSTALRFFPSVDAMDAFAKLLLRILNWFHGHTIANYGVAIVLLTVLVRMVMLPLTLKSMRSMKRMQLLAPEIEKLKEKYGEEQQELSKAMMELYRERGVNPLGGCFPMLLQMPVFIALYRMLWNAFELRGASFLWIKDLSQPDHLFPMPFMEGVPFLGQYLSHFNLLPLLMGAAMILSMKIMPTSGPAQNQQQKTMMTLMPIFFAVISFNFSAGLNLYVLTSTILGMVQQHFVNPGKINEEKLKLKKAKQKKRGQHFYARAKERQRQQAKAGKKRKKAKKQA